MSSKNLQSVPPLPAAVARVSRSIPFQLPAAVVVNGQAQPSQIPVQCSGDRFYLRVASAQVSIKGVRAANAGTDNPFTGGQGQTVQNGFEQLLVSNFNTFPVTGLLWVGFEDFINDQLVLDQSTLQNVTYPTQPVATGFAGNLAIPDLSGQSFLDVNGKKWFAVGRSAIIISNFSTGTSVNLQAKGATGATGPAVLLCPPGLPIEHSSGGDFSMSVGGGVIPVIVSEIYQAFAA
jgi:hypothetical protein